MDARLERASRNEAMYRAVNLEIDRAEGAAGAGADETFDVLCECGDDACSATLDVSHTEYEDAHRQRDRFMVAPGHEDERIEHIVKRTPRFLVVDKFGDAERAAEAEEQRQEDRS